MILYSDRDNHYSHRVRIVLAEKDITCEIREFDTEDVSDEILAMSNTHQLPILVDRDLNLSDTGVIMEYLDERFPHPPLLPVYPVSRASCRELILRIDREWCPLVDQILNSRMTKKKGDASKGRIGSAVSYHITNIQRICFLYERRLYFG
jgi:RNA polymerase-associated protein